MLRVEDDGVGISEETLPFVFELFFQEERPLSRPQGGLGLGLTLVRRLVELHGGTVQAASGGPGKGAAFVVRLPAVPAPAVETVPAVSDAPAGREHGHVLLVEDSADAREILRMILEQSGYLVTCAGDGPGGVAAALRCRPARRWSTSAFLATTVTRSPGRSVPRPRARRFCSSRSPATGSPAIAAEPRRPGSTCTS